MTRHRHRRPFTAMLEPLELRRLMSVVLSTPLPSLDVTSGSYPTSLDLDAHFTSTTITGTAVELQVSLGSASGKIDFGLYDAATPNTVNNFLAYVRSGAYNGTIFHHSVSSTATGSFIQGGGYYFPSGMPVTPRAGIASQVALSPGYGSTGANVTGTLAAYKADGDTNTVTSQFVINTADNHSTFDASPKSYAVFGRVLGDGMTLVNTINALPTQMYAAPFDALPVTNFASGSALQQSNVAYVSSAKVVNAISYVVTSSAPDLVTPLIADDGTLSLTYQPNVTGTATLSITATDLDGATLSSSFDVVVHSGANLIASYNSAQLNPAGGTVLSLGKIPAAANETITRQFTLKNTGSLDLSDITYGFSGGTAGYSLFNAPATALISGDSTTVIVKVDTAATGDKAGTLLISSVSSGTPLISIPLDMEIQQLVTLTGKTTTLTYVQGAGATATTSTFKLGNLGTGTATFALSGAGLSLATKGAVMTVSGAATLDSLQLVSTTAKTSVTLSSKGPSPVSIGTVTGVGTASLGAFAAKSGLLTGQFTWGATTASSAQISSLTLGTITGASVIIGPAGNNALFTLTAGSVVSSSLIVGNSVKSMALGTLAGGSIRASRDVVALSVKSGDIATSVSVSGSIGTAKIAGRLAGSEWDIGGNVTSLTAAGGTDAFALDAGGVVNTARFVGDFSGTISAASVGAFSAASGSGTTLVAKGTTDSSNVTTGGILKTIAFKGAVTAGYFNAANVIGAFSANALADSRLYAGVTIPSDDVLPIAYSAFSASSEIGSVKLAGKGAAYAFSRSVIAAKTVVAVSLGTVRPITDGHEGLGASRINSFAATLNGKKVTGKNVTTVAQANTLISGLTNTDVFSVNIFPPTT